MSEYWSDEVFRIKCTHLFLPGLKEVAVVKEEWLHLIDTSGSNEDEVEYSEQAQLKIE